MLTKGWVSRPLGRYERQVLILVSLFLFYPFIHLPLRACACRRTRLVSGAKPMTPKGSSRTAQGASPGFKVEIAESPERAAQGFGFQLQINAGHKAPHLIAAPLHRPFGASVVALLVPRACALGFPDPPLRGFRCCFACSQGLRPGLS